jgi:HK97 gp10 family phage protein
MDVSFGITGLDSIARAGDRVKQAVADEINTAVYAAAQQVSTEAKKSILDGHATGRFYKRRSVTHRASAPGEAPASDTGRLVNSISSYALGDGEAVSVAGRGTVAYAAMLEFGTPKMAARPFLFPALEKSKAWIAARLQDAVRRGIERAGR